MKHVSEEDLVLLYYNESGVPEDARRHLSECGECQAAAQSLAQALDLVGQWTAPEPEPEFGRSSWSSIAPLLDQQKPQHWFRFKVMGAVAASAALLAVAFFAGRITRQPAPTVLAGLSASARSRILTISLADHLDRAQLLLTEISNQNDPSPAELDSERSRAHDLVEEGRLLRKSLERRNATGAAALLDEVERFMVDVANAPENLPREEVRARQDRIASGSLLFKVRIIESNLRTEGQRL
jgi:hypothetical protein